MAARWLSAVLGAGGGAQPAPPAPLPAGEAKRVARGSGRGRRGRPSACNIHKGGPGRAWPGARRPRAARAGQGGGRLAHLKKSANQGSRWFWPGTVIARTTSSWMFTGPGTKRWLRPGGVWEKGTGAAAAAKSLVLATCWRGAGRAGSGRVVF